MVRASIRFSQTSKREVLRLFWKYACSKIYLLRFIWWIHTIFSFTHHKCDRLYVGIPSVDAKNLCSPLSRRLIPFDSLHILHRRWRCSLCTADMSVPLLAIYTIILRYLVFRFPDIGYLIFYNEMCIFSLSWSLILPADLTLYKTSRSRELME